MKRPRECAEQPVECKTQWYYGDPVRRQKQIEMPTPVNGATLQMQKKMRLRRSNVTATTMKRPLHFAADSTMLRTRLAPGRSQSLLFPSLEEKTHFALGYLPKLHQMLPLSWKVTQQHHQILRLQQKITLLSSIISCLLFSPLLLFLLFSLLLYSTLLDSTLLSTLLSLLCNALLKCSATRKFLHKTSFDHIFQYVWMLWKRSLPVHPFWVFLIISLNLTPPSSCKALYFCCSGARAAATASFMGSFRRTSQLSDCTWLHRGAHVPSSGAMTARKLNTHWKYPVQFTSFNHDHHQRLLVTM